MSYLRKLNIAFVLSFVGAISATTLTAAAYSDAECKKVGDTAWAAMILRHGELGVSGTLELLEEEGRVKAREIVLDAFSYPLILDNAARNILVNNFRDKWALSCLTQE